MLAAHFISLSLAATPAGTPVPAMPLMVAPQPPPTASADPSPVSPPSGPATEPPPAPPPADPAAPSAASDPLEGFNRLNYKISQPIDRFVLHPAAIVYTKVLPRPARDGVHNFLANLFEPVIFANDMLQLRPGRALRTAGRFLVNSTVGVGGLFDMARRKPFRTPDHPNGFADTLGYYGIPAGPYLYLPVIGPTNLRDLAGAAGDLFTQPRLLGKMLHPDNEKSIFRSNLKLGKVSIGVFVVSGLDERSRNDDALQAIKSQSVDPYAALRSSYVQDRAGEIAALRAKDGVPVAIPQFDDSLKDPAANPAPAAKAP